MFVCSGIHLSLPRIAFLQLSNLFLCAILPTASQSENTDQIGQNLTDQVYAMTFNRSPESQLTSFPQCLQYVSPQHLVFAKWEVEWDNYILTQFRDFEPGLM